MTVSSGSGSNALFQIQWNSPVPYLFGSLTIVFGIIGLALLFLACSRRKHKPQTDDSSSQCHADAKIIATTTPHDAKVLVIVPGDDRPTYLAKSVSFTPNHTATDNC
ncbi:hypothetical protein L6164_014458 [Bauhinia variegata]|uniref:Uncharacterized protein n=1 Tax=Bauhinia variegata TaxID=167791 RepID=A0ACB9NIK5_BAUVA|nr:hypothetical protein L6164_014458 [Bauhinia variegata]